VRSVHCTRAAGYKGRQILHGLQIKVSDPSLKECDIDAIELDTEIENVSIFFEDKLNAFDVLQFMLKMN